jgi:hypothetical protein
MIDGIIRATISMKKLGSKKASRPIEQIHGARNCGTCAEGNEVKTKSNRSLEKRRTKQEISLELCEQIQSRVNESLDNAVENGYEIDKNDVVSVVNDLIEFDADLEDKNPDELIPYVQRWLKLNS